MRHVCFFLCALFGLATFAPGIAAPPPAKGDSSRPAASHNRPHATTDTLGVERTNYLGWADSYGLRGSAVRAVVVPAAGGRILSYSLKDQNILFESAAQSGAPQLGGYQCDIGPELRGIPPHELLWKEPYAAETLEEPGLELRSRPEPNLGLQLEKEIMIDPDSGDLGITQRMRNISNHETSFCLWDRTLCKGGGFAFFPLKKKSHFPARWSLRRSVGEKFVYDGNKPQLANVQVIGNVLVAKCEGDPTKIGADSEAGWIAYVRDRLLFVKYFPYTGKGHYSDGGNSVELFFDRQVAELEPLSPEIKLKPGETYDFPEKWTVIELDGRVSSFAEARALVDKIPPSPF